MRIIREEENPLLRQREESNGLILVRETWVEPKKIWKIAGPSIFSRLAMFSMTVITHSFARHLGDLNLAAISVACTVIISISFGFLLGMASALEALCGQAYGARRYHLLGIYFQWSWIVLFLCLILLLTIFIYASPILKLIVQPKEVAEQTGLVAIWLIPLHFSFPFPFTLQSFFQSHLKTVVTVWVSVWALQRSFLWDLGVLQMASGVMLSYRVLIIVSGYLHKTQVALDARSICRTIYGWESMIPLGFLVATEELFNLRVGYPTLCCEFLLTSTSRKRAWCRQCKRCQISNQFIVMVKDSESLTSIHHSSQLHSTSSIRCCRRIWSASISSMHKQRQLLYNMGCLLGYFWDGHFTLEFQLNYVCICST